MTLKTGESVKLGTLLQGVRHSGIIELAGRSAITGQKGSSFIFHLPINIDIIELSLR